MTSIIYKIVSDFGECDGFIGGGCANVRVEIRGAGHGSLVIGSASARLSGGVAHMDLSALRDGEYTPQLFIGHKRIALERIKKSAGSLSRIVLDPELMARLLSRVGELEEKCENLIGRIEACELAARPKTLFN